MGDPKGFLKVKREHPAYRPVCERVRDYKQVSALRSDSKSMEQASRCMDCGTPFCHWACPIGNYIPEWNDLVFHNRWEEAISLLMATNNLPEVTGRVCPALCEYSCVLGINDDPVTIRENEFSVIEHAFKEGIIIPILPKNRTGKTVAIVGSGPSGLACADQLNQAGHRVIVFEKDDSIGGILRFGIPDFKLEKKVIDRRLNILKAEGIEFRTKINVGLDYPAKKLLEDFDAVCLAGGSRVARDLKIPGRDLKGIYFAMDYLTQSNRRGRGENIPDNLLIDANNKSVVVIGGGDTGSDCVGTANRQQAKCVVQIEVLPKPSECRTPDHAWPKYPVILKTSTSHEEGGLRHWAVLSKEFIGDNGKVSRISCVNADFSEKDSQGCGIMKEVAGSGFEVPADLVIIAAGFLHPEHNGLIKDLNLDMDNRGNVLTGQDYATLVKKVFAAGDIRRGQSLVVWAISEGRQAAFNIDKYLMGYTNLPML
ncbi:MAG: glutamate synthase subunit beta [Candidatus Omnitrophota bacterium]|nr:glutamate synthase subunit beta [Candidatus Omnitrophota bacterium]MBU1929732.1 glutamate synthase subunit beta [Candidatus Omnitrophota bacterium]MBU2035130.1 glutamate synthase subunit beta [Candidatus Omnitrophota bacterium]MBU2221887.1 glutamate synthase subunit beta [Candidatus Omnitrophota bacterium]MBU2257785.1 glutamate synthase subunit beta [Candidatus Omnitrophota bacterium]